MKNYYGLLFLLCFSYAAAGQVKFVIESLPETTPAQDSIFITGTFNNWNTTDPSCLLRKQPNGQLAVVLDMAEPVFEYKFTRGDWLKVETGELNEYIPNRTFVNQGKAEVLSIQIRNWQDLGGARNFEYLTFYYFAVALLSFSLLILSSKIFKHDRKKQRIFVAIHGVFVLVYMGAVAYYVVNPIWQTYLIILGQTFLFGWGPAVYLFIKSIEKKENTLITWPYFVPLVFAFVIAVLRLMNLEFMTFFSVPLIGLLTLGKLVMVGVGGVITCCFLARLIWEMDWKAKGRVHSFSRMNVIVNMIGFCFVLFSLYIEGFGSPAESIGEYKWFFVLLSFMVCAQVVGLWVDPQFFREKPQVFHIDKADELLSKLRELMEKEKVYHDADLSVNRLAELMSTKSHILSKLLNEHFEQNFRDYVNGYRVAEFIDLASGGKLEKLTYLGLAHEVGFNSKSTFNLAFKKITNKSPREYFKAVTV